MLRILIIRLDLKLDFLSKDLILLEIFKLRNFGEWVVWRDWICLGMRERM